MLPAIFKKCTILRRYLNESLENAIFAKNSFLFVIFQQYLFFHILNEIQHCLCKTHKRN